MSPSPFETDVSRSLDMVRHRNKFRFTTKSLLLVMFFSAMTSALIGAEWRRRSRSFATAVEIDRVFEDCAAEWKDALRDLHGVTNVSFNGTGKGTVNSVGASIYDWSVSCQLPLEERVLEINYQTTLWDSSFSLASNENANGWAREFLSRLPSALRESTLIDAL